MQPVMVAGQQRQGVRVMEHWDTVWSFSTARYRVVAEVTECSDDPADNFDCAEDVDAVRSGRIAWFDARVRVQRIIDGEHVIDLGADYLGTCAYAHPSDLFRDHARRAQTITRLRRRHRAELHASRQSTPRYRAICQAAAAALRRELGEYLAQERTVAEGKVQIGWYGPDMVREAVREARRTLAKLQD